MDCKFDSTVTLKALQQWPVGFLEGVLEDMVKIAERLMIMYAEQKINFCLPSIS